MSHIPLDKVNFADPNYDAFNRLRTSHTETIFEATAYYGDEEESFLPAVLANGGTATHLPLESSWALTTTAAIGSSVSVQTHQYVSYHPGKSHLVLMTAVFEPKVNVDQRVGLFNGDNGAFFEMIGTEIGVVIRTFTSGSEVNNRVAQDDWNIDKLDGDGATGITLDPSKAQIFVIDLQWLGAGRVRFGFSIGGKIIYCHEELHANIDDKVYMTSLELPLKYEIVNTGPTSGPTTLKQICSTVITEGDINPRRGLPRTWSPGTTSMLVPDTTALPMVSFQMQNPYLGKYNKSEAILTDVQTIAATDNRPILMTFIKNATLTGPTDWLLWDNTVMQYDITSTGLTGGIPLYSVLMSGKNSSSITANEDVRLHAGDTITVTAVALSAAVNVWGTLNWRMIL